MELERIELSARDRERLKVLHEVEQGHLQQVEAARRLRLTDRQVRRLQARLRTEGDRGIVHRLRGSQSNRKIPEESSSERSVSCAGRATPVSESVSSKRNSAAASVR